MIMNYVACYTHAQCRPSQFSKISLVLIQQDQDAPGLIMGYVYINMAAADTVLIMFSGLQGAWWGNGSTQDAACLALCELRLTCVCVCVYAFVTATWW